MSPENIKVFVKKGMVEPYHIYCLNMEALSEAYGWLPSEIEKEKAESIKIYLAILEGKGKRMRERMESGKNGRTGVTGKVNRR